MNRIGETNTNHNGDKMAILRYGSADDIDVIFESDNMITNTTYLKFKTGHVAHTVMDEKNSYIGETVEDSFGDECKIVEYISDNNLSVQYPDGDIVSELSLNDILTSSFNKDGKKYNALRAGIDMEIRHTYENLTYMLNRFRRCVMVRPCGFGKTKIGLKLFSSPRYQKCLFLHPADDDENSNIIKRSTSKKKIDTKTYAWLRGRSKEQIKALDYDIVFCDEVHCIGGDDDGTGAYMTYQAVKTLMESHPKTHFVGATATPFRMDGINVISTMFHNHTCYPYGVDEALEDEIIKKPYYYYSIYDVTKKLRDEIESKINTKISKEEFQKVINISQEELDEIDTKYMDKHIRETCDKLISNTDYMRFIAFYLNHDDEENGIYANKDKVINWFKKAYPEHQVESIIVTNRTNKSLKDIDNLPQTPTKAGYKGRIDIIFNCEKLCMGYHSDLITGLIIDRKTKSFTKYMQMIGRLLSCDNDKPVIIFDVADNIHSEFMFKSRISDDCEPVVPIFNEEATTFAKILLKYPHAIHWDEVKANIKKGRKTEKLIIDNAALQGENVVNHFDDEAASPIYRTEKDAVSEKSKDEINAAWKFVKENNYNFADACNYLSGIYDEYGTVSPSDVERINEPKMATTKPYSVMPASVNADIGMLYGRADRVIIDKTPVNPGTEENSSIKKDTIGYDASYYYDCKNRELLHIDSMLINQVKDFENVIKQGKKNISKAELDRIIEKWHTFPSCEENYKEYAEIDKKSSKYKFLKSVSEFIFSKPVEYTLKYMIEGEITV